jgi:hypothetical protein
MQTPVLLIAWQRADTLREVIKALRSVEPVNMFIACDGPKHSQPGHVQCVTEVRQLIDQEIDWECSVEKLYSVTNQGCRLGVSRAISWFFENVQEGIILEDDCVPHPDFFVFSSTLLERYRNDNRVCCISGSNFQNGLRRGAASYYFSKYPHCWGWATWRRSWQHYEGAIPFWPDWKHSNEWGSLMGDPRERRYWEEIFDRCRQGAIDSWAYPWTASVWKAGGVTAIPQVNLVQNIGFGDSATHTKRGDDTVSVPVQPLGDIRHPSQVRMDDLADAYVFKTVFARQADAHTANEPILSRALSTLLAKLRAWLGKKPGSRKMVQTLL